MGMKKFLGKKLEYMNCFAIVKTCHLITSFLSSLRLLRNFGLNLTDVEAWCGGCPLQTKWRKSAHNIVLNFVLDAG